MTEAERLALIQRLGIRTDSDCQRASDELRRLAAVEQERDRLAAEVEALKREDAYVALKANNDALRAEVEALRKERDSITELNHAQYLALENARLLAARHRKEDWAKHMLRFCDGAGVRAVHLRQVDAAMKGTP